MEGGGDPVS